MGKFTEELFRRLGAIESSQSVTNSRLDVYNKELEIHIERTTNLEDRIIPIEDYVKFGQRLVKMIVGLAALGASLASVAHYLFKVL